MAASQSNSNVTLIPGVPQSMPMRIGRSAAELAKPCFTAGSSRVSRSRATKALGMRKRKAVSPQSPPSPNQESAVNPRTGKVAFGPWLGPFDTHTDALSASGPLFLDQRGNTYASLTPAGAPGSLNLQQPKSPSSTTTTASALFLSPQQPHHQPARGGSPPGEDPNAKAANAAAVAATAAATRELYAMMVSKVVQRQAALASSGHQAHEKHNQWRGRGRPHAAGRCGSTMGRAIYQPRRS